MITYVAAQVDFDWARSLRHRVVSWVARLPHLLFFEDEKELTGVHDRVKLTQGLTFTIGPQDVENAANNASKHLQRLLTFNVLWRGERTQKLGKLLSRIYIFQLCQNVAEFVGG